MKIESSLRIVVVVTLIATLEFFCRIGIVPATVMISPWQMLSHLGEILASGKFYADIETSLINIGAASLLATLIGFVLGLIIFSLPALRQALEPLLASYYAVPTFIFYPIFIVIFGIGRAPIIVIAVLLALVTMITATLNGLDRIPRVLRKSAQVFRMPRLQVALRIELPAALPYLFTGMKLSIAYAFIGVIASEFILSGSGIGYAIAFAYNNFESHDMYALMLFVLLLVTAINAVLNNIDRRFQVRRER